MGFGHRGYKTRDPRAKALKAVLLSEAGDDEWLNLSLKVEEASINILSELKPGRALYTNVEFYAAAIMKSMNMSADLFTPVFTAARMTGWTAHILEQADNNTLLRPEAQMLVFGVCRTGNLHPNSEVLLENSFLFFWKLFIKIINKRIEIRLCLIIGSIYFI